MNTTRIRVAALSAASVVLAVSGVTLAAHAATPSSVTVGVGGAAPASATYQGDPVVGNIDPLGPPAPVCTPGQCDRASVVVKAPSGWTSTHTVALSVTLTYDDSVNTLDVGILDKDGNLLASDYAVASGTPVTAAGIEPGTYTVEVDGDIAVTPQDYKATVAASSGPKYIPPARSAGSLSFSRQSVADPFRLGTEPNVAVAPDGKTVYESPIFGFSTTQSFLQRSVDGGQTFNTLGVPGVGKLDNCTGGGDSDLATDQFDGDLYMIDLGGAPEVPSRVSHDKGLTFTSKCEANQEQGPNVFTDRQWFSVDKVHHKIWYIYRDGLLNAPTTLDGGGFDASKQLYGEYLKFAPLPDAPGTAGTAQITYSSLCNQGGVASTCIQDVNIAGNAVTDNDSRTAHRGTTYLALETDNGITVASFDPSGPQSVKEHVVAKGKHQVLFPTVAVDKAGTVYLAWTDDTNFQTYLSHNVGGNLDAWTTPVPVNGKPTWTTVMPWVVAGDKGRVDVVFYGTANPKSPTVNYGPWYPFMAQSLDADTTAPHFVQQRMTDRPNHIGPICLSGLGCTTDTGPGGDRELGDFFKVVLDKDGRALVSFADGDNQLGQEVAGGPAPAPSFAHFVRQSGGPSLFASVGNLRPVATPTNCATVGAHHNPVPYVVPATGTQGSDVAALQLRSSCLSRTADGGLKVTMKLASWNPTAATSPPALPTATYLARWVYNHHVYSAAAEVTGGNIRYFSGEAAPVSDAAAIKYAYYPASGPATGSVDAKTATITVNVPGSAVGSPPVGARLSTVTAYALTHPLPTLPLPPTLANYSDFPQVADVLPAYDALLTAPRTGARPVPGAGNGTAAGSGGTTASGTGGRLPATGTSPARAVAGALLLLAALGCAVLARRSRSWSAA